MSPDDLITSAEACRLVGVGPTALKRWADSGALPCVRTAGGHRRFLRADVERLRLRSAASASTGGWDEWIAALTTRPDVHIVTSMLLRERARAGSWRKTTDLLAALVTEIGDRWASGRLSVIEEHLASAVLQRALAAIADALPLPPDAPACLLATAEGNDHTVGLSLVELCLREAGWRAEWAGTRTPTADLVARVADGGLEMVALSAAANAPDAASLAEIAVAVGDACHQHGVHFFMGGAGAWPENPAYGWHVKSLSAFYDAVVSLGGASVRGSVE